MNRRHLFKTTIGAAAATVCPEPTICGSAHGDKFRERHGYKGRRCLNREELIKHFGWENGIPAGYKIVDPLQSTP